MILRASDRRQHERLGVVESLVAGPSAVEERGLGSHQRVLKDGVADAVTDGVADGVISFTKLHFKLKNHVVDHSRNHY